jgi:4-hydroxybenzoate polyprenyltransferase
MTQFTIQPTTRFTADRTAYIRSHTWLAALGMGGAMALLWVMGSPHIWTGAPAGLAAIVLRGWYLASEELNAVWQIDGDTLTGPGERRIPLGQIKTVRAMGSFVQIITQSGDKHLIKYQADPAITITAIERARL